MEEFTTKLTGIQYGLVKDHGKCDLQKAKSLIACTPMRDHSYSVHVFRNVVEPPVEVPQLTEREAASFTDEALELSLQSLSHYRLYEKCKVAVGEQQIHKRAKGKRRDVIGRQILRGLNENVGFANHTGVELGTPVNRQSIVSYMEVFLKYATRPGSKFLYIYNCETPPQGIKSCLNGISGHLDPSNNSRVEEMAGINTSMFYFGSAGSFTELHVEDSLADSVNILHAGQEKIWMVVDKEDYARLNRIIAHNFRDLLREVNDDENENVTETCVLPLQHKNLVVTPRFLDEHEVRYEFVVQKAGDMLYVRYGILHQVVNVGMNIAEAINVGSDGWNFGNDLKMLCPCSKCQLIHAATNTDVAMCVRVGKPKTLMHRCQTCSKMFRTKQLLVRHEKDDHRAMHVCQICDRQFAHAQSLNRHVRNAHSTDENKLVPKACSICKKIVGDIVRHKNRRHQKLVECAGCKMNFTQYDLSLHEKTCVKFTCTDCSKNFKSRQSLANHRARWCKKRSVDLPDMIND